MIPPERGHPSALGRYLNKWSGGDSPPPPRVPAADIAWSWLGALLGIGSVAWVTARFIDGLGLTLMIGSYGASAVLLFGVPHSPLAQPRNLIGGHLVSALIGVACWQLLHPWPGLAQALAVSSAIALMHLTRTLHPPGGATALIATLGSTEVDRAGLLFVPVCGLLGPLILLAVALVVNNLAGSRRYPLTWR